MSIAFPKQADGDLKPARLDTGQQAIDLNVGTKIDLYNRAKEELEKDPRRWRSRPTKAS